MEICLKAVIVFPLAEGFCHSFRELVLYIILLWDIFFNCNFNFYISSTQIKYIFSRALLYVIYVLFFLVKNERFGKKMLFTGIEKEFPCLFFRKARIVPLTMSELSVYFLFIYIKKISK